MPSFSGSVRALKANLLAAAFAFMLVSTANAATVILAQEATASPQYGSDYHIGGTVDQFALSATYISEVAEPQADLASNPRRASVIEDYDWLSSATVIYYRSNSSLRLSPGLIMALWRWAHSAREDVGQSSVQLTSEKPSSTRITGRPFQVRGVSVNTIPANWPGVSADNYSANWTEKLTLPELWIIYSLLLVLIIGSIIVLLQI